MNLKKLLSAVGLLTVATPATLSVVACGPTAEAKTDLKTIIEFTTINGNEANEETSILQKILELHAEKGLSEEDIDIKEGSFVAAEVDKDGSATIIATEQSKFTGEVDITITKLAKEELSSVLTSTEVDGNNANNEEDVLKAILENNTQLEASDIQIKEGSFVAAEVDKDGLATIIATEQSKFTGEVDITIKKLAKEELSSVLTNTEVDGNNANNEEDVLNTILANNTKLEASDIQIKEDSFVAAEVDKDGSATIIATEKSKFTGEVDITITKLNSEAETSWGLEHYQNDPSTENKNSINVTAADLEEMKQYVSVDDMGNAVISDIDEVIKIQMRLIWINILDEDTNYEAKLARFDDQEVWKYLISDRNDDNNELQIKLFSSFIIKGSSNFKGIQLGLTRELKSKTVDEDTGELVDLTLLPSRNVVWYNIHFTYNN